MITPLSNRAPARNDWAKAETLTEQALGIVQAGPLDNLIMSSLVYAVAARTALHRGDVPTARDYLARAARLRPLLTYAIPFLAVQTLLELGRAYLALDDVAGVRAVLWQACEVLRSDPTSASCPLRSRTCGRDWTWTAESAMVHPRSPQPSCACSRCWPPPDLPGDRPTTVPLPAHGQVPRGLDLPQARGHLAQPGGPAAAADRPYSTHSWSDTGPARTICR
jgi:hypothetical protein